MSQPRPSPGSSVLLEARGLAKRFGNVAVLEGVDLDIRAGEVHALVGENGAGKSTLIKLLTGALVPDAGEVRLNGRLLPPGDPRRARASGVRCVYQEFTLVPDLPVTDNIALGRDRGWWRDRRRESATAADRLSALGARSSPNDIVRHLSVAEQQLVEIARALEADARVVILDEPTAALPAPEVDRLLDVVRRLAASGIGVLYVSHRFDEIFAVADRITVLRDGRLIATAETASIDRAEMIRWIVGRDVSEEFPPRDGTPGDVRLSVRELSVPPKLSGISFDVRAGEVLGVAGLVGAGRTTMGLGLAGALPLRGAVRIDGRQVTARTPFEAQRHGIAYLTEDRKGRGLFPAMSARENLTIGRLGRFTRGGLIDGDAERDAATATAAAVDLRNATIEQSAGTLSGGTQQKVLFGRLLLGRPAVLVLDEPTRGVDVGARAEIYRLINRCCADGAAVVMISSELPELLGMADRVLVMRDGRMTGECTRGEASPERIMTLATGA